MARALVIGGGLAGCAAAVRLSSSGFRVTLLDRHPRLGGKVSSFPWPGLAGKGPGGWVDNGQHVATKACTALRGFLEQIGASAGIRWQERLRIPFVSPGGKLTLLERWDLPAPLHLLPGLLSFDLLPLGDRLGLRSVLRGCAGEVPDAGSFRAWLEARGQGPAAIRRFWDPLMYAVCNAGSEAVGASSGAWVVREGLLSRPDALDLGLPLLPQSEWVEPGVSAFLSSRGGEVRTGKGVESLLLREGRCAGALLRGGEEIRADAVVLAIPWEAAAALVPSLASCARLEPGAILSVTLRLDRPVFPEGAQEDFVALVDSPVQWAFSKTRIWGLDPAEGEVLSLVISGANALVGRTRAELVGTALAALRAAFPRMASASLKDAVVMKEKRATFLPAPGSGALRPAAGGAGVEGLALAGAWTATGWPATMEGAVRSGNAAARWLTGAAPA